jgi:hypothetical protein
MPSQPLQDPEAIELRLRSAELRLEQLLGIQSPWTRGENAAERTRLAQEFFFHLIGAVEAIAHIINERRHLMNTEDVTIRKVCSRLSVGDNLLVALGGLCQQTRNQPVPADPYGEDGLIFRAYLYRHMVTHRQMARFVYRIGGEPATSLLIDPRDSRIPVPSENFSTRFVDDELSRMLAVVRDRCAVTLKEL